MSLYAMGDLHLHFQSECPKSQLKDRVWRGHEEKFRRWCAENVNPEDTLLLAGDHSWGKNMAACEPDLQFIMDLPGRKILLRGNHDMFWDAGKTAALNERFAGKLRFLQGNYETYGDIALVGTKGFTFEGPFYLNSHGRVIGWDEQAEEHAKKIVERELQRLRESFEAAKQAGYCRFLMFLHYPPTSVLESDSGFTRMAEEYGAEQVLYAHCHGEARFQDSIHGLHNGIYYHLISGDYLKWQPRKILD